METRFYPTQEDVDRYLRLRVAGMRMNSKLLKAVPKQAYHEIGEALGFLKDGVLVFQSEDMTGVLSECCLYDWYEDGKNVVQRYAETHPAQPGTEEHYMLDAYLHARYRVLQVQSLVPGAGIDCRDTLNNEDLFVMDVAFSRSAEQGYALATRTIPLGEYWITTGAALPMGSRDAMKAAVRRMDRSPRPKAMQGPGSLSLSMVRACLDTGAAEYIVYETAKPNRREPRHFTRRNRRPT
ncbi:MAG TPA: hypothetical protein VNY05_40095 [Candidatus Acidoferrales bacterium]|jgi:hypothetical protein|nr:hypothetical protein [Candidatus Acidoferrales bacterium]